MNYRERELLVIRLREEGKTFREIGAAIGVATSRARQILLAAQHRRSEVERLQSLPTNLPDDWPLDGVLPLPVRAANCLRNSDWDTVGEVRRAKNSDLLRLPNLGRKSLREIREAFG